MPFTPTQPPDDSTGQRYGKAFRYVFAMLNTTAGLTEAFSDSATSSIVADGRFVQLVLPQQLSFREPYATVVTVMQDGGKVIESKGHVLKMASISGTTGFLPPGHVSAVQPQPGQLIPNVGDIDTALGYLSGYLAFMKLRYLFRMYGDERRRGNLDVQLHFFDYKNDDFWRIEPESFDMQRSSRRPMSYDYSVAFKCIEYSDAVATGGQDTDPISLSVGSGSQRGGVLSKISGGFGTTQKPAFLVTTSRFSDMVSSALSFLNHCDAVIQRSFQSAINAVNSVVAYFQDAHDAFFTQFQLVTTLMAQLDGAIDNLFFTANEFAPDNINQEINAWLLEVRTLADHMAVQVGLSAGSQPQRDVQDTDVRFSQGRMKQGATTDLMQEPPGSTGSPDANPFIGTSGLSLVTDPDALANGSQYTMVVINTGEDIYAFARRVLGDISRFIDLVLINRLEFPFIVADSTQKPPNTLAWGERALVPTTTSNTTNTTIADGVDTSAVPSTSGVVSTSSLPSQLIDVNAAWLTDQWVGYSTTVTTGSNTQTLIVISNTATQLTLNGNWTISITPTVTTYVVAYNTFNPRRPLTADARAYGTDLLVVFDTDGRCDLVLGARSDLAAATGLDNLIQAITLRSRCPIGQHPFHKSYGLPAPVGRPAVDSTFVLYTFFIRRSLLADPRVGKVSNVQLSLVGDTWMLDADVQPVDSRLSRPITTQVGT